MATAKMYPEFFNLLLNGSAKADSLTCTLHDDTNGFNETHSVWADVSGSEITDTDYSEQSLSNISITTENSSLPYEVNLDADDITFGTSVTISAYHAIIRDDVNDNLLFHVDFGGLEESSSGEFTLSLDSNGLFDIVVETA